MGMHKVVITAISIVLITAACESASTLPTPTPAPLTPTVLTPASTAAPTTSTSLAFALASAAFKDGETIPATNTCDDQNVSPELHWSNAPSGTASFALIVDDPDAGGFTHWVLFDIPASAPGLAQAETSVGVAGANDFSKNGYGGPCPPNGAKPHHYAFKLYALDVASLNLPSGARQFDVEQAMLKGKHVLGQAKLSGIYGR